MAPLGFLLAALVNTASAAAPAVIAVHADQIIVAQLSPALIGAGIEDVNHELVGAASVQMLFGEGFEEPAAAASGVSGGPGAPTRLTWAPLAPPAESCVFSVATGVSFTGAQSQGIEVTASSSQPCGIVNRGLDAGGLSLEPGVQYALSLYAKTLSPTAALNASLLGAGGRVITSALLSLTGGGDEWVRVAVNLTVPVGDAGGATCFADAAPAVPCYANAENLCITCSGSLALALQSDVGGAASVLLDQVVLSATSGGRGPAAGGAWATRDDVAALLSRSGDAILEIPGMGLTALRLGGSAILVDGYRWKRFRGPPDERQPYAGFWYPYSSSRWGIFEFLALCEALPVHTCVVTLNSAEAPGDVGDLVEYAYGDVASTFWGAQRAADGHPAPYAPFAIEIGNEQDHTDPAHIAQVAAFADALQAAAARLSLPFSLQVAIGVMYGTWPAAQALPLAAALAGATAGPGALDIMLDFHIGGDDPASDPRAAFAFIASVRDALAGAGSRIRGAVLEENGSRHDLQRALGHVGNANRLACLGDFVRLQTAANGLQVLGRNDNSWDQGQLFVTQNGSYLAPHGMANSLLSAGPAAAVVAVEAAGLASYPLLDTVALMGAKGAALFNASSLILRVVNAAAAPAAAAISIAGCAVTNAGAGTLTLAANASGAVQNYPWAPLTVAPVAGAATLTVPGGGAPATLEYVFPPLSVTAITVAVKCAGGQEEGAGEGAGEGAAPAAAPSVPTTCDAPAAGGRNLTALGHTFTYFNAGPWGVATDGGTLTLACGSDAGVCFDEAIAADAGGQLAGGSGTVSVEVSFGSAQAPSGDDDAGLLLRCGLAGTGPGEDAFACYELSLGPNRNASAAAAGSGFVLLGVHWLPSHFALLVQVPWDVPLGAPHALGVALQVAAGSASVSFAATVNGVFALNYTDAAHAGTVAGDRVGLRAFYTDAAFAHLVLAPASTSTPPR